MKNFIFALIIVCLPLFLSGQEIVEKIEIEGNDHVTRDTILYYLSSREGDYYSEELLRRDFKILWSTGFFSNIKIERKEGKEGKIVKIIVEENPIIKEIVYKTGKKLKEDDIVKKLKEENEYLLPYSYYSPYKIQRIEEVIKGLLAEKGLTAGEVRTEINKSGKNEIEVVFRVNEGPKVRVGEIVFEGKAKLRDSILRSAVKENRKHGIISWVLGKDSFKQNKLSDDLENLKKKYQEFGYMEAVIGEPRIEDVTKRSVFLRKQQMKRIIIPVNAGYRYFVGDIKIEGNKIFNSKFLRSLVKYNDGDIYSIKVREKAVEDISELYRNFGYLYSQVMPVENLDPKRKRVNVTFNIYEGEIVYLNRLEFEGNIYTKDKVIRREMLVREGDRFSLALFKDSLLRMKQLGLVEVDKEPEWKQNPEDPTQMDVTIKVTELQRNNIQFTAGYSGYQGTFVALSYGTVNFLGAGEKLDLTLQYGKRMKNYSFGFTEPYFLDLPISLGFTIFDRFNIYPGLYDQKSRGVDFNLGSRIKGYSRANISYNYQFMTLKEPSEEGYLGYYGGYGGYGGYGDYGGYGGGYNPYYYGGMYGFGKYNVSSISPTLYRNTVDSPLTPSRGTLYLVSCKFAGGILGGDINLIKPRFEWSLFQPVIKNHSLGFHLEYQFNKHSGGSEIPFWERFYLGGERSIRGYNIYSIGPRNEDGRNMGGEKSFVFNAEYIMPVGGPIYLILFYDAGNAYGPEQKINIKDMYTSAGLEVRIFIPAVRVPFRLIFSYNNRKIYVDDNNFTFRFAVGTTF